ncbi:MAG: VanZ family protein [Propionibacteriaceae bacterium]|nr:VanZ family protein [Micropruina sp.]
MSVWMWSGQMAVLLGGIGFLAVFIPLVARQYRKFGRLSGRRLLVSGGVSLYLTALFTYTLLPLPERSAAWCAAHGVKPNLHWFSWVAEFQHALGHMTTARFFTSFVFLQVAFNVLLFVPWGIMIRSFLHRGFWVAVLSGFAMTVLIETTQATGLWGIYPCAYRTGDVDDVFMNTLGAVIGALLAPLFGWIPQASNLSATRHLPHPVTARRRWMGMLIDGFMMTLIILVIVTTYTIVGAIAEKDLPLDDFWITVLASTFAWAVVYLWPAAARWHGGGGSLGMTTVWLTPVWERDGRPSAGTLGQRLWRLAVPTLYWVGGSFTGAFGEDIGLLLSLVVMVFGLLCFLLVATTKTKRGLSGVLSGARIRDLRELVASEDGTNVR